MKAQNSPEELAAVKHAAENLANLAARWAKRKESQSTIQLEVRHGLNSMPPCYSSFTIQDEVADALFEAAGSPKTKEDAERTREHCKAVSDECDRQERMTREKIAELENKIAGLRARCSQAYSIRDAHRSLSVWVKDKIKWL